LISKCMKRKERKNNLKMEIMQKKVFDFIEQNANIKTVEKKIQVWRLNNEFNPYGG